MEHPTEGITPDPIEGYMLQPLEDLASKQIWPCEGKEPTPNETHVIDEIVFYAILPVSIGFAAVRAYGLIKDNYGLMLKVGEIAQQAGEIVQQASELFQ